MMDGQQNFDSAKQTIVQTIQQTGVPVETFIQLGQLAEQVFTNKQLYPQFIQAVLAAGLGDESDFQSDFDYQTLISMIAMGRVAREMTGGQS